MPEIINTHDQLMAAVKDGWPEEHALAICKGQHTNALVYSPFFKTNPDSAWYDYGQKSVFGNGINRVARWKDAAIKAKKWVKETYGYDSKWTGNRMRDLVPAEINKKYPLTKT